MFNEDLLDGGYAQLYNVPPNDRYEGQFRVAQEEARDAGLGIWGLSRSEQSELADRGNGIGEGTPGCVRPQKPEPQPQPKTRPAPSSSRDLDCADFESQAEAQETLLDDPSDPNGLDADDDGQACETSSFGGSASASASASASISASATAAPSGGGGGRNSGASVPAGGDIDCDQVNGPIRTPPGDPDNLDGDGDGWACE